MFDKISKIYKNVLLYMKVVRLTSVFILQKYDLDERQNFEFRVISFTINLNVNNQIFIY